jgi:glycerol kinase
MGMLITKKLTNGRTHATDITNASRSMLMDINTLSWKPELCKLFGVPHNMLPNILNCSDNYGLTTDGVPING